MIDCEKRSGRDECPVKPICSHKDEITPGIKGYFHQGVEYDLFDGDRVRFKGISLTHIPSKVPPISGNYQIDAMRTRDPQATKRLLNKSMTASVKHIDYGSVILACLGLSGEVGEFNDLIKKVVFHEKEFDEEHLKKELGDICWYIALACDAFGWKLEDIMRMNIEKLSKRYPDGFDVDRANHRKEGDV